MEFKFFGREIYIKKSFLALSAVILLAFLALIGYLIKIREQPIIFISQDEDPVVTVNAAATPTDNKLSNPTPKEVQEEIKVYITGCVKKPGIITLKKGQLIYDAINAAGGLTDDADKNINMVYALNENVWLDIKSKKEADAVTENKESNSGTSTKAPKSGDNKSSGKATGNNGTSDNGDANNKNANNGAASNEAGSGISIVKDSGGVLPSEKSQQTGAANAKININTASAEELDALPGIGPAIAADIVDYRNKNGEFKAIEDLLNVPGIGQSKFNRIKDNVTLK
ncbi:MAG TPA: helix-hairpin-helix domain-containing protein [Pseudobacteroides sp.]|nr:helix-hairpin-helix domain-containing protein [Pseudobacteroides sp.]